MLIRSLYGQVVFVLLLLAGVFLSQLWLSRDSLHTFSENQKIITQSYNTVALVYELERDIIDLQRNLLIYKATASDTSVQRFYTIIERLENNLVEFKKDIRISFKLNDDKKSISRMEEHLTDYQDNFSNVINGRRKRAEIISEIEQYLADINDNGSNQSVTFKLKVSLLFSTFKNYLVSPDAEYIDEFKAKVSALKKHAESKGADVNLIKDIVSLKKKFIRLTHVTRGYVYLVNVVMAGSASEFLYLSEKIRKDVNTEKDNYILQTKQSTDKILFNNNVVAISSIIIALLIAWFLSNRILLPVEGITNVFKVLAKGGEVGQIPGTNRTDEVGDLAKAAAVFHEKNKQTHELLERSQDMIANQELLNIQLEQEKDKAEKAALSKSMFLANMSHEIRTPMNGIIGLVDLTLKTDLTEKQINYLNRISYSGQIMMNVINDILDFSKIEAGKMVIEKVDFEINVIIENLISSMAVRVDEKNVDFRFNLTPSVPNNLLGDPLRISQILMNLCSNAIKFTDDGYLQVDIDYKNGFILITIADTGIGMTPEQTKNIFQSFTQADGSTSRKYGGTGLGLTIVKQLVQLMDGEVSLESEVNKGTQVHLKIRSDQSHHALAMELPEIKHNKVDCIIENPNEESLTTLLNSYGLNGNEITADDLSTYPASHTQAPIFIQVSTLPYLQSISHDITRLKNEGVFIGFLLSANAINIKDYIFEQWHVVPLSHPFSPKQSKEYVLTMLGANSDNKEYEVQLSDESSQYQGHVLLVEDNMINQLVAGDMLESMGLTFDLAEDGKQAVDKIQSGQLYDMVFMDVQMPIMDGYTASKTIRENGYNDLIICGLSANALPEDLQRAYEVGMNDYLTKPLQLAEMEAKLKQYLT